MLILKRILHAVSIVSACLVTNSFAGEVRTYPPRATPYDGSELVYCTPAPGVDNACSVAGLFSSPVFTGTMINTGNMITNGPLVQKGLISCANEGVSDYINTYAYGAGAGITCEADGTGSVTTVGGTFSTRTKNWSGGTTAQIGAIHWGFADMPTASGHPPVWAQYSESRKYPGTTGFVLTDEHDITNFVTGLSQLDPYDMIPGGSTLAANVWLASGGSCGAGGAGVCYNPLTGLTNLTPTSAQAAVGIANNQGDYLTGIAFQYNALHGVDGKTTGAFAPAISMGMGQTLEWASCNNTTSYPANCAANHTTARIGTQQDTTSLVNEMIFYDNTINFQTTTNSEFVIVYNNSDTEGLQVSGDSAGNTPKITAVSSTAPNVNIGLTPKGTGTIVVNGTPGVTCSGTPTSSFATINGIVTHC